MVIISNFFFRFHKFLSYIQFFWLTFDILFSTVVRAAVAARLVIPGLSPMTSFILALREALVAKLVISGILSSIFLIYIIFTTSLSLLKSIGAGTNLSASNLPSLLSKLVKLVGTYFSLSISYLSKSDFKLAKLNFLGNFDVSTPAAFFNPAFVA